MPGDDVTKVVLDYVAAVESLRGAVSGLRELVSHRMDTHDSAIKGLTDQVNSMGRELARREDHSKAIEDLQVEVQKLKRARDRAVGAMVGYGAAGGTGAMGALALIAKGLGLL